MRVAVAGGAGFLGTHLCERLLAAGDDVLCIDNFATATPRTVERLLEHPRYTFIEHDLTKTLLSPPPVDAICNLASPASPPDYRRLAIETLLVNAEGARTLLDWADRDGAHYMVTSTSEVYGDPEMHPQREEYWGHVNPVGERSCYDEGKRYGEALATAYRTERGVDVRIARLFNTYGPGMRPDDGRVISNFIVQALTGQPLTVYGNGQQTRSFCFVDDTVDGLVRLLKHPEANGAIVNIGNPDEYTIAQIADRVVELLGGEIVMRPLPADDPRQRCPDITRARTLLGWSPSTSLEVGLSATVEHFRAVLANGG